MTSQLSTFATRELSNGDTLTLKVSGLVVYATVSGVITYHNASTLRAVINSALQGYNARVIGKRTLYGLSSYNGVMYQLQSTTKE